MVFPGKITRHKAGLSFEKDQDRSYLVQTGRNAAETQKRVAYCQGWELGAGISLQLMGNMS